MDSNVQRVRELMNSDPKEVGKLLVWYMANPAGDDPRVLALCLEIIEKSTNTTSVWHAVGAIGSIIDAHKNQKTLNRKHKEEIAAVLERAMLGRNYRTVFYAVLQVKRLGGRHEDAAFEFYRRFLDGPPIEDDQVPAERQYIGAIRELIKFKRPETATSIRRITKEYNLLTFYDEQFRDNPKLRRDQEFVDQWKAVMAAEDRKP